METNWKHIAEQLAGPLGSTTIMLGRIAVLRSEKEAVDQATQALTLYHKAKEE